MINDDIIQDLLQITTVLFPKKTITVKKIKSDTSCMAEVLSWNSIDNYIYKHPKKVFDNCISLLESDTLKTNHQKDWIEQVIIHIANMCSHYEAVFNIAYSEFYKNEFVSKLLEKNVDKSIEYWSILPICSIIHIDQKCLNYSFSIFKSRIRGNSEYRQLFIDGLIRNFNNVYPDSFDNILSRIDELETIMDKMVSLYDLYHYGIENNNYYSSLKNYIMEIKLNLDILIKSKKYASIIEKGSTWMPIPHSVKSLSYLFIYPNGKQGDIEFYVTNKYATVKEINALEHEATFSYSNFHYSELLPSFYYMTNTDNKNNNFNMSLRKYNYIWLLHQTLSSLSSRHLYLKHSNYLESEHILNQALKEKRARIDQIYMSLVAEGKTTPKWKSEQQVYALVVSVFPNAVFQYHCEWLGSQSLDIFIPDISTGIEYQGIIHYEAIPAFGGEKGFKERVSRDKRKKRLCKENGVKLIEWKYDEPINMEVLNKKINHP